MRHITVLLAAAAVACAGLLYCKKSPEPCWDTCEYPRKCFTYSCECPGNGQWFYETANMCIPRLPNPDQPEYIALLPEVDFLDTFGLQVAGGHYSFRAQRTQEGSSGSDAMSYHKLSGHDSVHIAFLPPPGTGPMKDGWPTLNGKKFFFKLNGTVRHDNRDTLYAQIRWFGLGTADDLQEPLDFKMHVPKEK